MNLEQVTLLARQNHGVLLPNSLDDAGITPRQRQWLVRRGIWRRLPNRVLVISGAPDTFEMFATATLIMVSGSVLSHTSAARIHGLGELGRHHQNEIHISVPPGSTSRANGAVLHRSPMERADLTNRHGFAVTSIERTLLDLGAILSERELRRTIENALVTRITTFARIEAAHLRLGRQGRKGSARLSTALRTLDGLPPSESELEAQFLDLIANAGLARPLGQVTFEWAPGERGRVDLYVPDDRLIIEVDGRKFHARLNSFERDRRRDQLAMVNGLRTVRFTHHQVFNSPGEVLEVVRALTPRSNRVLFAP